MVKSSMKKMVSMLLAVSMLASVSVSAAAASLSNFKKVNDYTPGQFTDVPADSWCAENVQVAYEYGLMGGKSSTTFDPNGSLTVAQTIVMASRLHNIYNGSKVEFASGESPWYAGGNWESPAPHEDEYRFRDQPGLLQYHIRIFPREQQWHC